MKTYRNFMLGALIGAHIGARRPHHLAMTTMTIDT